MGTRTRDVDAIGRGIPRALGWKTLTLPELAMVLWAEPDCVEKAINSLVAIGILEPTVITCCGWSVPAFALARRK